MSNMLPGISRLALNPPFVRGAANLRDVFRFWMLALAPCVVMALWNTGYQANAMMQAADLVTVPGWRGQLLMLLGNPYQADSVIGNLVHGAVYFFPILAVALFTTFFWETVFARLRRRRVMEGGGLLSLLFALILPPSIPLWQVMVGMSFAVVVGKEVFGGTGMYLVHPVLAGRAFLYFAYPDQLSGESVWTVVDAMVGATPLDTLKTAGPEGLQEAGITQGVAFIGMIPGSLGETSTLAVMLGAALLLWARLISWRIIAGALLGLVATSLLVNGMGSATNYMAGLSWSWHVVLGGFAFGLAFIATDPVVSPMTHAGRWIYGGLIGFLLVLIRVSNPAIPEGMMFAVLLANVLAPLIDHGVVRFHIRRRQSAASTAPGADDRHD